MALIVGTDTYVTESELTAYATKRGITIIGDLSVLLTKALDYLETRQFIGTKTVYNQALQWPRILCGNTLYNQYPLNQYPQNYNVGLCEFDSLTVPTPIKNAQLIAALLIDVGYDLQSTLGQAVKSEKVDVIEVVYQDNTSSSQQFRSLNDILRPFLQGGMRAVRA